MIEIILAIISSLTTILVAVISAKTHNKVEEMAKITPTDEAQNKVILAVGRMALIDECKRYLTRDEPITAAEYHHVKEEYYDPYKWLNGNGRGDMWFNWLTEYYKTGEKPAYNPNA